MEKVHVLITVPLEERHLKMVAATDPSVEVNYAMEALRAERGAFGGRTALYPYMPQPPLTPEQGHQVLDDLLAHSEVAFGLRLPTDLVARAPRLKWVHTVSAGVDNAMAGTGLQQSNVIITNSTGLRSTTLAEFALCLVLMLAKKAPILFANQREHRWKPNVAVRLSGKTLGIVGLGHIGSEIARRAQAFDMKVLATRRSATSHQEDATGVEVFPPGQLLQVLPLCDFVVLSVPLTAETRGVIGEAELKAMKPTAYLVNIARGPLVQEKALVRALKEGWIAGAALDVFAQEPLPPESELWDLPNLIISPHTAGFGEDDSTAMTELFCENLRRFLSGQKLLNVIDKARGY